MRGSFKVLIDDKWCKGCGLCLAECPKEVLIWSGRRNAKGYNLPAEDPAKACTGCQLCELICPDQAIRVEGEPQ